MGEECIRIKLRNCRIGIAIMADIRPLNHLALIPVLLPAAVLSLFTSTYQRDILRRARAGSVFSEHFLQTFVSQQQSPCSGENTPFTVFFFDPAVIVLI